LLPHSSASGSFAVYANIIISNLTELLIGLFVICVRRIVSRFPVHQEKRRQVEVRVVSRINFNFAICELMLAVCASDLNRSAQIMSVGRRFCTLRLIDDAASCTFNEQQITFELFQMSRSVLECTCSPSLPRPLFLCASFAPTVSIGLWSSVVRLPVFLCLVGPYLHFESSSRFKSHSKLTVQCTPKRTHSISTSFYH
jgi:hypothetical protein